MIIWIRKKKQDNEIRREKRKLFNRLSKGYKKDNGIRVIRVIRREVEFFPYLPPVEVLEESDKRLGDFATWSHSSSKRRIERLVGNLCVSTFLINQKRK